MTEEKDRGSALGGDQRRIVEKAREMKQAAGPGTTTPPHETPIEGAVTGGQVGQTDTAVGKEATCTSNLKRSHNARTGDT